MKAKKKANLQQYNRDRYEAKRKGSFEKRIHSNLYDAKKRAKKSNVTFDLVVEDFKPRETCPCCGEHFGYDNDRHNKRTSPSIDRLNPAGGYTKDNCWVICNRCNTIKNNATVDELEAIAREVRAEIARRHE